MEIRKIKPQEKILASKIQTISFLSNRDFSTYSTEPEKFERGYETTRAAFNDEGKLCSCMELIPYQIRFDGHTVNMGGIGGVATLPEERNKGYVRHIFTYCFEEMRENNQIFSYLFPFSHVYYRKFGYERSYTYIRNIIPFSSLSHFPRKYNVKLLLPDMERKEIISIYNQFIADKNLAVVRNQRLWNHWLDPDPYNTNQNMYVWYDVHDQPRSYIIFNITHNENGGHDMQVKEFVWLDNDSLLGILGFLNEFKSQFTHLIWNIPDFIDLQDLFPEPYNIKREILTSGMNRIVDLQKVFELMKYPSGAGELVISVEDANLKWNSDTYSLRWDSGGVQVQTTTKSPDLICNIQSLCQLITGSATIQNLAVAKRIQINSNTTLLSSVFKKKPQYITDGF
jgi:predicted acetyltransferase